MTSPQFGQPLLRESCQDPLQHPEPAQALAGPPTRTSALLGWTSLVKPFTFPGKPYEYKVTALRECPTPDNLHLCDTPDKAADYWCLHVPAHPYFNAEAKCFVVLLLNTRRRVAAAIVLAHNLSAAAHKFCEVNRRFIWSCQLLAETPRRLPQPKELYARM